MTHERFSRLDMFFILVSLVGVVLVNIGAGQKRKLEDEAKGQTEQDSLGDEYYIIILASVACLTIPFISAWSNILMRRLKGLHRQTITSYIQCTMSLFTIIMISV